MKTKNGLEVKIIQQETGNSTGVQQHAERPGTDKTFCGVKYIERKNWYYYGENHKPVEAIKQISCSRCRLGIEIYLKNREQEGA